MSTLASVFGYGLLSARPAAAVAGRFYYATDTTLMYRDNGATWDTLAIGAGAVGSDSLWDAKGDLAVGTGANTAAKLTVGANDTIPMADSGETTGIKWVASQTPSTQAFGDAAAQGTADTYSRGDHKHAMPSAPTPVLRLDYTLASDISNQAITGGTYFDLFANQNFTVGSASSLIEVIVRGFGFCNDAANQQFITRVNIDSGGTPVIKYINGAQNTNTSASNRPNCIGGGSVYVSGLSAATHTIKAQFTSIGNDHLFIRASTNTVPTTGAEFLMVQVIEHP